MEVICNVSGTSAKQRVLVSCLIATIVIILFFELWHSRNPTELSGLDSVFNTAYLHTVNNQSKLNFVKFANVTSLTSNGSSRTPAAPTVRNGRFHMQVKSGSNKTPTLPQNPRNVEEHAADFLNDTEVRSHPYRALWVGVPEAPFLSRLQSYNRAISDLRQHIKSQRGFRNWNDPSSSPTVLWGSDDKFLEKLSNFTEVRTVSLTWLGADKSNLLVDDYYEWVGSEPLCTWIRTPGHTKARWDALYDQTCTTEPESAVVPKRLEPVYLHGKPINPNHYWPNKGLRYPEHFYTSPPDQALYVHVSEDSVITGVGDVFTGSLKIVPYTCSHDTSPEKPPGYRTTRIYAEVFIMSGHWGTAHFHKSVELLPRVAPYVQFLTDNPDILVHVSETGGTTARLLSSFLGISSSRLVSGVVRAKIAYMPQGTPCGFAPVQGSQILSKIYRDHVNIPESQSNIPTLVMVHRSGMRRISDSLTVEMTVKDLAEEYGLEFYLYHDQQLPSLEDTMLVFRRAALVLAPHGAGESNLLFCEPGTYVVELVCNPPHVNMCYQRLAHILGMRYHGIPSEAGCEDHIEVNPAVVKFVVRTYLEQWKSRMRK